MIVLWLTKWLYRRQTHTCEGFCYKEGSSTLQKHLALEHIISIHGYQFGNRRALKLLQNQWLTKLRPITPCVVNNLTQSWVVVWHVDWPQSSSWTFQTQFEPNFEPEVQGSGSAEYLNLNLLGGSGLSRGWTQTWSPAQIIYFSCTASKIKKSWPRKEWSDSVIIFWSSSHPIKPIPSSPSHQAQLIQPIHLIHPISPNLSHPTCLTQPLLPNLLSPFYRTHPIEPIPLSPTCLAQPLFPNSFSLSHWAQRISLNMSCPTHFTHPSHPTHLTQPILPNLFHPSISSIPSCSSHPAIPISPNSSHPTCLVFDSDFVFV